MRRLLLTAVLGCLLLPAAAWASGEAVIKDCTDDGVIQGHYSQQDYKNALANLPTDVDEYTDCRDVIKRAQTRHGRRWRDERPGSAGRHRRRHAGGRRPARDGDARREAPRWRRRRRTARPSRSGSAASSSSPASSASAAWARRRRCRRR